MRLLMTVLALSMLTACTALVVGGSSGGYQNRGDQSSSAEDSALTVKIRNNFAADSILSQLSIGIRSYSGTVTLTGSVNDYVARDRAGKVARETAGVLAVNNQVLVAQ